MTMAFISNIVKALLWNEIQHQERGRVLVANGLESPEFIEEYSKNRYLYISAGITMDDRGMVYREIKFGSVEQPHVRFDNNPQIREISPRVRITELHPDTELPLLTDTPNNESTQQFSEKVDEVKEEMTTVQMKNKVKKLNNKQLAKNELSSTRDPGGPSMDGTYSAPKLAEITEISPIMKRFDDMITIDEAPSSDDLKDQKDREEKTQDILDETGLCFKSELFKYQRHHTKILIHALKKHGCAVDASDTGTGKTHCAIIAAKNLGYNIIVMCPKSVIPAWQRAGTFHNYKNIDNSTNLKKLKKDKWIYVTNYEQFKFNNSMFLKVKTDKETKKQIYTWKVPKKIVLIVDECHRAKNHKTQNSKMLYAAYIEKIPMMLLSATMIDRVPYMYTIGYLTGIFHSVMHFKQWIKNRKLEYPDQNPSKICMKKLHDHIFPERGSRMTIDQLGDKFPDNNIIYEPCQIGSENKQIHAIYAKMVSSVEKIIANKGDSNCILTVMLRARQSAELMKVVIIAQMVQDFLDEGKSVAVFLSFNDSIEQLALTLKTECVITGDNPEERQELIDQFQADKSRIIICNSKAGGVGISLHDLNGNYPRVSIIVPSWSAMEVKQCLGRIARAGGKTKCIQKILYCSDSIEETIVALIKKKIENIDMVNDGPIKNLLDALKSDAEKDDIDFYESESSESETSESSEPVGEILCSIITKNIYALNIVDVEIMFDIRCGACYNIYEMYEEYKSNKNSKYLQKNGIGVISNKPITMTRKKFEKKKERVGDSLAEFVSWKKICQQYESEL